MWLCSRTTYCPLHSLNLLRQAVNVLYWTHKAKVTQALMSPLTDGPQLFVLATRTVNERTELLYVGSAGRALP